MGTTWSYDLFITSRNILAPNELKDVARLMKDTGFLPINPSTGSVTVSRVDEASLELIIQEFKDIEEISSITGIDGSLLTVWYDDIDVSLGFNLKPGIVGVCKDKSQIPLSRISLMVDNTHFHDDADNRNEISNNIETLFRNFCEYFEACYGCSYNEETLEMLFDDPFPLQKINLEGKQPSLFWVNYFSDKFVTKLNIDKMVHLGSKVINSSAGCFIFFSNQPWEMDLSVLFSLNKIWQKELLKEI